MTKQEILDKFRDIDFVYNDSSKHETLSRMLDELLKEQEPKQIICKPGKRTNLGGSVNYFNEWYCPHCGRLLKRGLSYVLSVKGR